jgi:hypothetical protein
MLLCGVESTIPNGGPNVRVPLPDNLTSPSLCGKHPVVFISPDPQDILVFGIDPVITKETASSQYRNRDYEAEGLSDNTASHSSPPS